MIIRVQAGPPRMELASAGLGDGWKIGVSKPDLGTAQRSPNK